MSGKERGRGYSKFRYIHLAVSVSPYSVFLLYRHTCSPQLGTLTRHFLASMSGTDSTTALYCRFWGWNKERGEKAGLVGEAAAAAAGDESKREERDNAMCARMRS